MKVLCLVAAAALALFVSPVDAARAAHLRVSAHQAAFVNFVRTYSKTYPADEFLGRYNVFSENLQTITKHNAEAAQGKHSWTMAVNKFSDISTEEFLAKYTMPPLKEDMMLQRQRSLKEFNPSWLNASASDPDFVDWRTSGLVTNVKDQGACGSCWAFSAVAAMESARKRAYNVLFSMSEQELVDCCPTDQGCYGCNGGFMTGAFQWAINNGGVTNIENYPYVATQQSCHTGIKSDVSFHSYVKVPADEDALRGAVANVGVISIGVSVSGDFQHYSAGIYDGSCDQSPINHGVAAIGYGHDDPSNKDFFIVKNSWGEGWGASGYIYIRRGVNKCNINSMSQYINV